MTPFSVRHIPWETFEDEFRPIANEWRLDEETRMFETYGPEYDYVVAINKAEPERVWTVVDADGDLFVVDGWHWVNRFGYIITEKPAEAGVFYEVPY